MRIKQVVYGLFVAFLLASSAVSAQDYPASNFQPKVIYSSEEAAPAAVATAAANPCIASASAVAQVEVDPKYPAANFQPKVIYSSADTK